MKHGVFMNKTLISIIYYLNNLYQGAKNIKITVF